jgi:hypothetical protein
MSLNPYQPSPQPVIPMTAVRSFRERHPRVTALLLFSSGIVTGCALGVACLMFLEGILHRRYDLYDSLAWLALPLAIGAPIVQYSALRNSKHLWVWLLLMPAIAIGLAFASSEFARARW